jgi:hypothetical protein
MYCAALTLLLATFCFGQETQSPKIFHFFGTYSPSIRTTDAAWGFYLHGNLSVYLQKNLSVSGDLFSLKQQDGLPVSGQQSVFFGPEWHHYHHQHDLSFGMQPGLLRQTSYLQPLVSPFLSYRYFVHPYLHFFVQARYVYAPSINGFSQADWRFSGGLAFQF